MDKKEGLKILLQNPIAVLKEGIRIQEQSFYKKKLMSVYKIQQLPTIDLLDLFANLDENIDSYSFLTGTSLVTDLILLKSLARKFANCAYLEIGSWRGESLINVSNVTSDCTSITLSEEEMREMNVHEDFIKVHGVFSEKVKTIKKIEHNSQTYDFKKLNKKFDLVFIDGDHTYKGVLSDTRKVFPLRKNKSSIIVWHDYGFNTEHVRYTTLKGILDGIPKDKHKNLYHISNTMCAIYMEDMNFTTQFTQFPSYPNKMFTLKVVAKKLKTMPSNK